MTNKDADINALINGSSSVRIQEIMDRHNLSAMSEVEKREFKNMIQEIQARSLALDVDMYTRKLLVDQLKTYGKKIMNYESDLLYTQGKIADLQKDLSFHRSVLTDLKDEYVKITDPLQKIKILEEIDKRESAIEKFQKILNDTLDIRNKIRKEIDKKEFNEKALKLKEQIAGKDIIDITTDVDLNELDSNE